MAGVKIYMANTTEELVKKIEVKRRSPFDQLTFVTQTAGIKHYLSLKLADRESVFCHSAFLTPNELMMDVARLLGNPNSSEFSTENMRWRIFSLLDNGEFKDLFPFVKNYYKGNELKRIQLATKLADLFDQYIVYRTDMMNDWLKNRFLLNKDGVSSSLSESEEWQKWLWVRLKKDIGGDYKDKAEYQRYLLEKLTSQDLDSNELDRLRNKYSDIHVFGLTVLTKFHMELLWHLKNVCNVYFYFVNPCVSDFWYDSMPEKEIVRKWWWHKDNQVLQEYSSGNELLTSWGKVVQELFTQLFTLDDEVFSYIEYEDTDSQEQNTLLEAIQYDIKNNIRPSEAEFISSKQLNDKSIQVTSHYSKVRELEVLFDYLADLIDNHYRGKIEPHEVVVMLPQVEEYVPYIRAVFDNAPRKIPYSIGDRSASSEQSAMTVALELLQVISEEFTSESVLGLLDYHLIREKYEIKDVNAIRRAVRDVNVKHGITGEKELETHLVSWEQGLRRIIMGVFMRDSAIEIDGEMQEPYLHAEGNVVDDLVSFVSFVRNLIFQSKITRGEKRLSQWNEYFVNLLDRLVLADELEQGNEEIAGLKKKLETFNEIDLKLEGVMLSFESYLYILKTAYENEKISDGYYRGRVTFCQALPMRSIPFKVVAFLGLNKNDFPRQDANYAFDLIKVTNDLVGKNKLGDRMTKDNDKYLFLEALLNAQDFLYLSYEGRGVKDNKEKSRSGVLDELLDYIQNRTDVPDIKKLLITQHPLQSFSKEYLKTETGLFTYQSNKNATFEKFHQEKKNPESLMQLDLEEILKYYKHPVRYFMQRELGIYDNTEELLLSEQETFLIENNLEKYLFKKEFLENAELDESRLKQLKKQGRVPLRNMALIELENIKEKFSPVINGVTEFKKDKKEHSFKGVVGLEKAVLTGAVVDLWDDTLLGIHLSSVSKLNNTLFLEYLKWLFLRACGEEINARVIYLNDKNVSTIKKIEYHTLSIEEAKERLDRYLFFYLEKNSTLVPFYPAISEKFEKKPSELRKEIDKLSEYDYYLSTTLKDEFWDSEEVTDVAEFLMKDFKGIWK